MIFVEDAGNFREHRRDLVGLGGQDQNIGRFCDFPVGGGDVRAGFIRKMFSRRVERISGDEFARKNHFGIHKTFGQCGGHFACAEKTDL